VIELTTRLNGREIGSIEITRLQGGDHPDDHNTYEATIRQFDTAWLDRSEPPVSSVRNVTIRHRYGDPWPVLLAEILDALAVTA
jgi:hypothetical protein